MLDSNESMTSVEGMLILFPTCCTQTITALVTVTWKLTSEQLQLTKLVQTQFCTQDSNGKICSHKAHCNLMPDHEEKNDMENLFLVLKNL